MAWASNGGKRGLGEPPRFEDARNYLVYLRRRQKNHSGGRGFRGHVILSNEVLRSSHLSEVELLMYHTRNMCHEFYALDGVDLVVDHLDVRFGDSDHVTHDWQLPMPPRPGRVAASPLRFPADVTWPEEPPALRRFDPDTLATLDTEDDR